MLDGDDTKEEKNEAIEKDQGTPREGVLQF
jgi:hypothetical protein